jgi:ADP-heptose:LPS heptosyltransferase
MQAFHPCPPVGISLPKKAVALALGMASTALRVCRGPGRPATLAPKAVLLEPFGMGDALSLLPLVTVLHAHGHQVVVCARPAWRTFFPDHIEWVDSAIPWASYGDDEKYRLKALFGPVFRGFLLALRHAAAGHIGIDTRGDSRSTLLLWMAGCRTVYSLDRYLGSNLKNLRCSARMLPLDPHLRRWQVNTRFATALGCSLESASRPHLTRRGLAGGPNGRRPLGIIPITPWPGRAWPPDRWQELLARLLAMGEEVLVLAGPGQEAAVRAAVGPLANLRLCQSIDEWVSRLSGLEAVVALDSGPAHLADALDIPLVALYGSGQLPLWAPSGPRSLVLHRQDDPDYQPIHPVDANIGRGLELMSRHTVEEVFVALMAVRSQLRNPS